MADAYGTLSIMSHMKNEGGGCCSHTPTVSSVQQTLTEMEFERGLWSASLNGELGRVEHLLSQSCDVNAPDSSSYAPLVR